MLLLPWDDDQELANLLSGSLVIWRDWMSTEACRNAAEAMRSRGSGDWQTWKVVRRFGCELVGAVELHSFEEEHGSCEIGYWANPLWTGRGLMTEAVQKALKMAWTQPKVRQIRALCDLRNGPAQRLAERAGMIRGQTLFNGGRDVAGCLCDLVVYHAMR